MRLGPQLNISFALTLFVPMLVGTVFSIMFFSQKIQEDAISKMRSDLKIARLIYQNSVQEMSNLATAYAQKKTLAVLIKLDMKKKLDDDLAASAKFYSLDMITLVDSSRKVLGRSHLSEKNNKLFPAKPYLDAVFSGASVGATERLSGDEWDAADRLPSARYPRGLAIMGAAPIYDRQGKNITGAVIIHRILDHRSAVIRKIHRTLNLDTMLFEDIRLVGSAASGQLVGETALPSEAILRKALSQRIEMVIPVFRRGGHISVCLTIRDTRNKPLGILMIQTRVDGYLLTRDIAIITQIIIFLTGCFLAFIMRTMIERKILTPVKGLREGTERIARGDYHHTLEVTSTNEIGELSRGFNQMAASLSAYELHLKEVNQKLVEYNKTLEQKVEKRTEALNTTLQEVEAANEMITDSIQYARRIQRSLLTSPDIMANYVPNSFYIWMPKDIVGGDFIFTEYLEDGFIIAVVDCTGHGVPGAFMTMIASAALRRIISDGECYNPGEILRQLNFTIKTLLHQDSDRSLSDDGLDAGVCFISEHGPLPEEKILTFAGARLPLYHMHGERLMSIDADKQSIGYRRSDLNFNFTNHVVNIRKGMSFYMLSDGFTDQLGGEKGLPFGKKRLKKLLQENADQPFETHREVLFKAFYEYKGERERQDDVTVVGFTFL